MKRVAPHRTWSFPTGALLELLSLSTRVFDPEPVRSWSAEDWDQLLNMASLHGVMPLLYHRMRELGLAPPVTPPEPWSVLHRAYLANAARNTRAAADLEEIVQGLGAQGIRVIGLKGIHAAESIYENIALRVMGDLDLMVPKEDALRAFEWVQTLGYRPSTKGNNDAGLNLDRYHHLFQLRREGSFPVELHWTIHHSQRPPILPVEELWKRAEAIRFGQVKLLGLSLEDLLLHIAWHPSGHHLFEADLRPLCDIDWMLSRTTSSRIQWPVLRETAQRWGWSRGIFLTLRIAHELFHTPIPAAIEKEVAAVPGDFVNGACEHLLLRSDAAGALTLSTLRVWKSPTLAQKVREFFRGWIVPRDVMAHKYPVNPDSPLVYWYYLVRIRDILRRHGRVSMRLLRGNDARLAAWAEIKENMARWIQS